MRAAGSLRRPSHTRSHSRPAGRNCYDVVSVRLSLPLLLVALPALDSAACTRASGSREGDRALRAGDHERAATLYREAADASRTTVESQALHVKAGDVYDLYLEKPNDAVHEYRQAIAADGRSEAAFEARVKVGRLMTEAYKDPRRAIEEYNVALANHPSAPGVDDVRFRVAKSYFEMGERDQARVEFQKLLEATPDSVMAPEAAYDIADSWFVEEKFTLAEKSYREMLARYPGSDFVPQAEFGLARCLEETDKLAEALALYQKVAATYPNPEVVKLRIERLLARNSQLKPIDSDFGIRPDVDP